MPRKKAAPPAKTPETEIVNPAPEAEALPVPPAPPQAEPSVMPEPEPSAPPAVPEEETAAPEDTQEPEASPSGALEDPPDFVNPGNGESPPEPEAALVPEGLPAIVTASKGLNFRAGPGFGFDVLGVVEFGTLLIVLDLPMGVKVPGWALVWLGETAGWVSDKYLRALVE